MKCLVTGANGVVGGNLFRLLAENYGFDVYGCSRTSSEESGFFSVDLTNRAAVLNFFLENSFDYVVHCAADINGDDCFELFRNNIASTINVVEASVASGVKKIFHTSSVPVVGNIIQTPIDEGHPTNPLTGYHLSKLHSEQIIELYCKGRVEFINMRIPSPVGLNMPLRSVFPIFMAKLRNNENVTLTGDACRKQNFLDMRDLASFIHKASLVDGKSGLFIVAAVNSYSNMELAQTLIAKIGSKSKIINQMVETGSRSQIWELSTQKAYNHFGYVSEYNLDDTIDWLLE